MISHLILVIIPALSPLSPGGFRLLFVKEFSQVALREIQEDT